MSRSPRTGFVLLFGIAVSSVVSGQTVSYPYYSKPFAGVLPLGDGGPATSAILNIPTAAVTDLAGNLYILDANDNRIRKVSADGRISTLATLRIMFPMDMKLGPDGNFYVGGYGQVAKVSPAGVETIVAGTGTIGYDDGNGLATSALLSGVHGIALDSTGNVYFTDSGGFGSRVRMVTVDGRIRTIAGSATYSGNFDSKPATSAYLVNPSGIALDNLGNVYVADFCRIGK